MIMTGSCFMKTDEVLGAAGLLISNDTVTEDKGVISDGGGRGICKSDEYFFAVNRFGPVGLVLGRPNDVSVESR